MISTVSAPATTSDQFANLADRTGIAHIDGLIDSFLSIALPRTKRIVSSLRFDPQAEPGKQPASGKCGLITRLFADYVRANGIECRTTDNDIAGWVHFHNYADLPFGPLDEYGSPVNERLDPGHCAPIVFHEDFAYMIDFTAGQYGYPKFPFVQRLTRHWGDQLTRYANPVPAEHWQRQW